MKRGDHGTRAVRQGEIVQTLIAIADAYANVYRAKGVARRLALTAAEVADQADGDASLAGEANLLHGRAARFLELPRAKASH